MKTMLLILQILFLVACAKPDSTNLEDKRNRELEVENENTKRKAMQLEEDLARKQRLFSAMKGTYEGAFIADKKEFKTKLILVPSLPPYDAGRTRTLEELTADLNNLYFTVQTIIINAETNTPVMDCSYSQIKPDYDGGQLNVASERCVSIFFINLYSSNPRANSNLQLEKPGVSQKSQDIVQKIFSKQLSIVSELFIEMNPTMGDKSFLMILKRTQQ